MRVFFVNNTILLAKVIIASALFIHFGILAIYHLPNNPIKHQFKYNIISYMNPFFSQEWKLFAPNPISANLSLDYKFKIFKKGKIVNESGWLDSQVAMVEKRQANFWAPTQRITKFLSACAMDIVEQRSTAIKLLSEIDSSKIKPSQYSKIVLSTVETSFGHRGALSYSKYVFKRYSDQYSVKDLDSVKVEYRIISAEFPRFSKRYLDYYDKNNYKYKVLNSLSYKII